MEGVRSETRRIVHETLVKRSMYWGTHQTTSFSRRAYQFQLSFSTCLMELDVQLSKQFVSLKEKNVLLLDSAGL